MILDTPSFDVEHIKKALPVLTGQVCFAFLTDKNKQEDLSERGYIKQPPVAIPNTNNVLTAYVHSDVIKNITTRKDVIIAPYVAYSFFKQLASKQKNKRTIYALVVKTDNLLQSDFYIFNKGVLEELSSHSGFDEAIISRVRQQDNRHIKINIYTIGDIPILDSDSNSLDYFKDGPFDNGVGFRSIWKRLSSVKTQRLVYQAENILNTRLRQFTVPVLFSIIALASIPIYSLYKEIEFNFVREQFDEIANSQDSLPDQAELTMWESRNHFIESLDKAEFTTTLLQGLLKSLSAASKKVVSQGVFFERMDINLDAPIEVNNKSYNVVLEVGMPVNKSMSPEEQTARFATALTESLGRSISGSVDVWDDVIKRQINSKDYVMARFYIMHSHGSINEHIY